MYLHYLECFYNPPGEEGGQRCCPALPTYKKAEKLHLITLKWQLLRNDVSTGAAKPREEVMPPLWMAWQKVTLALGQLHFFLRNAAECAAGETKFYCLTFPVEVEKLFDKCVIIFMGATVNPVPLDRLLCSCVLLPGFSVPNVLPPVGIDCQRLHSFICITALCFFRVFLRAINKFAETMNQKFLENMNFEVQVSI